jgi:hypothetical protein
MPASSAGWPPVANPNKAKGTAFERQTADYWQEQWSEWIDRRAPTGGKDKGDLANVRVRAARLVIEVKNSVSYKDLSGWVEEAATEAVNDGAIGGIVVHKRKGKGSPGQQYVTMTQETLLAILHAAVLGS